MACSTAFAGAANDRLLPAVNVGNHNVVVDGFQDSLDFGERGENRSHFAGIVHRYLGHAAATGTHGSQCVLKGERAGRNQSAVFSQAVSHRHVGMDAVRGQHPGEGQVDGQHGGLSDLGLAQIFFRLGDGVRVGLVNEDIVGQRLAEQRGHDAVGFVEEFGHDWFGGAQRREHVDVLRALPGVEERHFTGRAASAEDALGTQRLPDRGLVGFQRLQRIRRLDRQLGGVSVVDRDALDRA